VTDHRGAQLSFVGLGYSERHITLEGFATLKRASRIFFYGKSSAWLKKLFPDAVEFFP
jgi:hypothetical protein